MNDKELGEQYGIVRVNGYWRRGVGGIGHHYVRPHYRAAPGTGPLGEP